MSKELRYENDASPNREHYYSNVNYVYIKTNRNSGFERYNNQYKISLEGLHSIFELAEESGNMKKD